MVERRKPASIDPLLHWASEREKIRLKKLEGLPPPWTNDPFLNKYRFCNVRRRDDRVSQWLINNAYNCDDDMGRHVFIQWVALCRWINWPPTLEHIISDGHLLTNTSIDLPGIGDVIDDLVLEGDKAWTGAYMVRAPSKKKYPGVTKGRFVAETVVGALADRKVFDKIGGDLLTNQSCKATWENFVALNNWGSFMAGQVVADLTYTPLLSGAYDLCTWAPQGPGSKRGFNRLLGRPLKTKIEETEWTEKLQEWRWQVVKVTGLEINLMDLQNFLCETDKYLRVKYGEGRPRSTYKPESAY